MRTQLGGLLRRVPAGGWTGKVLLTLFAVVVVTLIAFARMPAAARGVVWAEDGGVFLRGALASNGLSSIFAPYDGYLHVLPRLAAQVVVRFVPVDDYGLAMNFLSCLVTAAVSMMVFHCAKEVTSSLLIRLGWASITVLVAPAPLETLANFANIHSYLLWLTPWLLIKRASSRGSAIGLFLTALLVALTEIVSALFIPLFALGFRDRSRWPARFGLTAGLLCQAVATLSSPRAQPEGFPLNVPSAVVGWFLNSPAALVYGNSATIIANVELLGSLAVAAAAVPFAIAATYVFWKGSGQQRVLGAIFLYGSASVWFLTQAVNFQEYFDYLDFDTERWKMFFLSRYSTVPSMFLLAILPLAALCDRSHLRRAAAVFLCGFVLLQVLYFFPQNTSRNDGPDWRESVRAARAACNESPSLTEASVSIAPQNWLKGGVPIDCAVLRQGLR